MNWQQVASRHAINTSANAQYQPPRDETTESESDDLCSVTCQSSVRSRLRRPNWEACTQAGLADEVEAGRVFMFDVDKTVTYKE